MTDICDALSALHLRVCETIDDCQRRLQGGPSNDVLMVQLAYVELDMRILSALASIQSGRSPAVDAEALAAAIGAYRSA